MLTLNKMKQAFAAAGLALVFSCSAAHACMPVNPICLFKMVLKATPGMPVFDFVSVPAIIPHVPAALLKEGQSKMKEIADKALEDIRSGKKPSLSGIKLDMPNFEGAAPAPNSSQDYASLEAFPISDSEDPLEVAKSIETIFLRPGWKDEKSEMSQYDTLLLKYYQGQFKMSNAIELTGFTAYMQNRLDELMVAAEEIQKQIEEADDLNKAQRANYAAHLMEYQLAIVYNQLLAAELQLDAAMKLGQGFVLEKPVFGEI